MKRQLLGLAVACAVIATGWLLSRATVTNEVSSGQSSGESGTVVSRDARNGDLADPPPTRLNADNARLLSVLDEYHRAVSGALAVLGTPRRIRHTATSVVAVSHDDGVLAVSRALSLDGLTIVKSGFLPKTLSSSNPTTTVILNRGLSHRVKCLDLSGNPMEGVRIALSRFALPNQYDFESIPAGTDVRSAIYSTGTNARGIASFGALTPGGYFMGVHKPGYTVARTHRGLLKIPGEDTSISMTRISGAAVKIVGDEIVKYAFVYHRHGDGHKPRLAFNSLARRDLNAARDHLRGRFENCLIIAAATADRESTPVFSLTVLLRLRGPQTFEIQLEPLDALAIPRTINVSAVPVPAEKPELVETQVDVRDALGRLLDVRGALSSRPGEFYTFRGGERRLVPTGTYSVLLSEQGLLGSYEPMRVDLSAAAASDRVMVRLASSLRQCKLQISDPWGDGCGKGWVDVRTSRATRSLFLDPINEQVIWLPVGSVSLSFKVEGCVPRELVVSVSPPTDDSVLPIKAKLKAR